MRSTGARGRRPSPYPRPAGAQLTPRKRTTNNRRRYLAGFSVLAVAAAITAGFMSTGSAMAEGDDDTIVFNGSCGLLGGGLLYESKPDKTDLEVVEGDTVTFVNNLGNKATLHVGQTEYSVDKDDEKAVTMTGSAEVLMTPDCALRLGEFAKVATVSVSPAPEEPTEDSGDTAGDTTGSDGTTGSGNTGTDDGRMGVPDDGDKPPADDPAAKGHVPDPNKQDSSDDSADRADDTVITGTDDSGSATDSMRAGHVEAVNTSDATEGASGMLAVLATVCLVGVGIAAVRTMAHNRATARA